VLPCDPLACKFQRRRAIVHNGHFGELRDADDRLDDTRVWVANHQPAYTSQLAAEGAQAARNSQPAQPRFMP
jgi:hypothetical protein